VTGHHKIAIASAFGAGGLVSLDAWGFAAAEHIAWWHALYCVWMTAITVGGDVPPTNGWGYTCLALAPVWLVGAIFGFFTSGLAASHVNAAAADIKTHAEALHRVTRLSRAVRPPG